MKRAVLEAQKRYDPKAIFILTTCTSGVIGEDIEGAVAEIQPEVKATIVPIHCEGVRSRLVQTGYDAFWHGVLKYLVKKPGKKQKDIGKRCKYVIIHMARSFRDKKVTYKVGLRVNFVPEFATVRTV